MLLLIGSVASSLFPELEHAFIFDRQAIITGEIWRLFTCHLVHFSLSHLTIDLAVLALSYLIAGKAHVSGLKRVLLLGILCIGPALFCADPLLLYYGGSSGLASGALLYSLKIGYIAASPQRKHIYAWIMAGCVLKSVVEIFYGNLFATLPQGIASVPLCHLYGYALALSVPVAKQKIPQTSP